MNMEFQRITPLWETFPSQEVQPAGKKTAGRSVFADIFQGLIDNVRTAEDDVAKKEYLLSTGQLDNPVELNLATYKAEVAMTTLVQLREKALTAYNELSRISM